MGNTFHAPTVFVIQDSPGKNLTSALDYGQIEVLLPESRQITFSPGPIINELRTKLASFTDEDYLLLIGDPAAIGIACAAAAEWNRGRFKILKWDRQSNKYFPIQVDFYIKKPE
jgi:hypothetical protein